MTRKKKRKNKECTILWNGPEKNYCAIDVKLIGPHGSNFRGWMPKIGIFHLITHALFKALLFMCAGNYIHSLRDNQDIRWIGGLGSKCPWLRLVSCIIIFTRALWVYQVASPLGCVPVAWYFQKNDFGCLVKRIKLYLLILINIILSIQYTVFFSIKKQTNNRMNIWV